MPRATSSTPTLRRNQACRTCRKKKLKCDAARPHCGQCVKHWKGIISVPPPDGYAHPEEPQCSYDPIEGLTLADSINPGEKIRQLEEQIAELKRKLQEAGIASSPSPSEFPNGRSHSPAEKRLSSLAPPQFDRPDITLPRAGLDVARLGSTSPSSLPRSQTSSPDTNGQGTESILSLFAFGWNPDLPDPAEMRRLIEVFFLNDPCGSRILHMPTFLVSMALSPKDDRFPHSAILHAICASASRWTSTKAYMTPDGIRRDTFADYHAGKTRQYIDRTMASGAHIFDVLQACIILSWYFYTEGRWVEVWIFSGFQTRVAVPLRLNHKGTFSTHGAGSPGAYLPAPKDHKELEMRRRTWWMSVVLDRIVSVGGWLHGVEYKHIATELPLRRTEFESELPFASNPQNLRTENFYITHPPDYTDSFLLFIKAVMLFGLVTDLNTEIQLKSQLKSEAFSPLRDHSFLTLDKLVAVDFLQNLPLEYKHYLQNMSESQIDTDLYMVHLIPHAASITLHNPYLDFNDPHSLSTNRCIVAANAILEAYYAFSKATVFSSGYSAYPPIVKLHPFVTICWYLAAVVKIQVCKHMINNNQPSEEIAIWGEINAMRHAMLDFGSISPIGTRQEKLLGTLMAEIVRSTSQDRPLEIGGYAINGTASRLYPHSAKSAFQNADGASAPLPTSPPMEHFGTIEPSPLGMSGIHAHVQATSLYQNVLPGWLAPHTDISRSPTSHSSSSSFMA
ncbi:hypothetical protein ACEPAI_746 [Sanghuangporus weigelae]